MVFTRKSLYFPLLPVLLHGNPIPYNYSFKFLGVVIDFKLNWKLQINRIQSKLSKVCGIIYSLRNKWSRKISRIIYLSLALSYLNYCTSIWSACNKTLLESLFVTQKKIIRVIMKKRRIEPSSPLFKRLNVLKLQDIIHLNNASFVYKSINNIIPNVITFESRALGPYNLRRVEALVVPFSRSKQSNNSIRINGAKLWNDLPDELRNNRTILSFKRNLKKSYFLRY